MQRSFKPILIEILWLLVALVAAILVCRFVFFWDFSQGTLDIHLYDTYFIFPIIEIAIPIFLLFTSLLYFLKELRNKFRRTFPNIILLLAGLLLITFIVLVNKELIKLGMSSEYTAYPPLSALPKDEPATAVPNPFVGFITTALTVFQLAVTIASLYAVYHWGKQRR